MWQAWFEALRPISGQKMDPHPGADYIPVTTCLEWRVHRGGELQVGWRSQVLIYNDALHDITQHLKSIQRLSLLNFKSRDKTRAPGRGPQLCPYQHCHVHLGSYLTCLCLSFLAK